MTATSSALVFAHESVSETWNEAQDLIAANHHETGALPDEEFELDRSAYFKLEIAGILRLYTVRDAGKLMGYALFTVSKHSHYRNTTIARQDVLYVVPAYRGVLACRFIEWTDAQLKGEGVQRVLRHVTEKVDYSRVLEHLGYRLAEWAYLRTL